jgi:hypothetical protein
VSETSRVVAATVGGALLGGVAGYLLFTDQGRLLRRRIEPAIEDFGGELKSLRATLQKAATTVSEGWRLVSSGDPFTSPF